MSISKRNKSISKSNTSNSLYNLKLQKSLDDGSNRGIGPTRYEDNYENLGLSEYQQKLKSVFEGIQAFQENRKEYKNSEKKVEEQTVELVTSLLPDFIQNSIYDINSETSKKIFQNGKNKNLGLKIIDNQVRIVDMIRFQKNLPKFAQNEIVNQLSDVFNIKILRDSTQNNISITQATINTTTLPRNYFKFDKKEISKFLIKTRQEHINPPKKVETPSNQKLANNEFVVALTDLEFELSNLLDSFSFPETISKTERNLFIKSQVSTVLDIFVQENLFNPESPEVINMFETKNNIKLGLELINGKVEISNFDKFRKNLPKFSQNQLQKQIMLVQGKVETSHKEFETQNEINSEENQQDSEITLIDPRALKFDKKEIQRIIIEKRIEMNGKKETEIEKPKHKTNKKPQLEQILHGPPKPTKEQIQKAIHKSKYDFTHKINKQYGHKIPEKILSGIQLSEHYKIIDEEIYSEIELQSKTYNTQNKYKRSDIKQAQELLDYIKHSWGTTNHPILKDVKSLARQTIVNETEKEKRIRKKQELNKLKQTNKLKSDKLEQMIEKTQTEIPEFKDMHFDNFYEVLEYVEQAFPDTLIIPDQTRKEAKKSKFKKLEQAYIALTCLSTQFHNKFSNPEESGNREDLDLIIRNISNFTYAPRQNSKVIRHFPDDYLREHNNEKIKLHKHLRLGTNTDEKSMIRFGFEYLPKEKKIFLGYIGRHQRLDNRNTN